MTRWEPYLVGAALFCLIFSGVLLITNEVGNEQACHAKGGVLVENIFGSTCIKAEVLP